MYLLLLQTEDQVAELCKVNFPVNMSEVFLPEL